MTQNSICPPVNPPTPTRLGTTKVGRVTSSPNRPSSELRAEDKLNLQAPTASGMGNDVSGGPSITAVLAPPLSTRGETMRRDSAAQDRSVFPVSMSLDSRHTTLKSEGHERDDNLYLSTVTARVEHAASSSDQREKDLSQESQLLQLSRLAAAQERMPSRDLALSRKRMADGLVKQARRISSPCVSCRDPSRDPSTALDSSTSSPRLGEVSAGLKARLSYAMIKVNHGWQSCSIDQIETLASRDTSPASSTSTTQIPHGASVSPRASTISQRRRSNTVTPATERHSRFVFQGYESRSRVGPYSTNGHDPEGSRSPTRQFPTVSSLAPPIAIYPAQPPANSTAESYFNQSPQVGPQTPGRPSPFAVTPKHTMPIVDQTVFSPHQNVREQDAIESLLCMSSPANPANIRHARTLQSPADNLASGRRTALPASQPRKSLPSGRPTRHVHSRSQPVLPGPPTLEKSPQNISHYGPTNSNASKRKTHGGQCSYSVAVPLTSRMSPRIISSGLTIPPRSRRAPSDDDIEKMLSDMAAKNSDSDSDGEIAIP